jgi:hypothetical protein
MVISKEFGPKPSTPKVSEAPILTMAKREDWGGVLRMMPDLDIAGLRDSRGKTLLIILASRPIRDTFTDEQQRIDCAEKIILEVKRQKGSAEASAFIRVEDSLHRSASYWARLKRHPRFSRFLDFQSHGVFCRGESTQTPLSGSSPAYEDTADASASPSSGPHQHVRT